MASIFEKLNGVDVGDKIEDKNGLSYLSWAWAWAEVKKVVPDASYTVYERETEFGPCPYFTDGRTCWVKTGVTLGGLEHIEMLPVMDHRNRSIPLEGVTSMDVNKTIQRSLTKACARHGLGLYIYAGEDLPEGAQAQAAPTAPEETDPGKRKLEEAKARGKAKKAAAKDAPLPPSMTHIDLRARMENDNIPERELQKYVAGKGFFPAETPVDEYPEDFLSGFLMPKWEAVVAKIKADPEYVPF